MPKELIKLEDVMKTYTIGDNMLHALDNVTLSVKDKDFITILGPSGCGKSTLLHMLGLLDTPTSGNVFIDGINVSTMNDQQKARIRGQKIGFIFQSFNLIPSITAL